MIIIGIAMLIVSILGFIICSAMYITCLGISKMLEKILEVKTRDEKRRAINFTNQELIKK